MKPYYSIFILLVIFCSCSRKNEKDLTAGEIKKTEEALVGVNRMMIQKDKIRIEEYIQQHHLSMIETQSGLWYGIIKEGKGKDVQEGMTVTLAYELSLLDGTTCYKSDSLGVKEFLVGQGGVESGLEEGILLLKEGSKAVFILPPHLAYGLPGDGDCIPRRSIIVYQIEIIKAASRNDN